MKTAGGISRCPLPCDVFGSPAHTSRQWRWLAKLCLRTAGTGATGNEAQHLLDTLGGLSPYENIYGQPPSRRGQTQGVRRDDVSYCFRCCRTNVVGLDLGEAERPYVDWYLARERSEKPRWTQLPTYCRCKSDIFHGRLQPTLHDSRHARLKTRQDPISNTQNISCRRPAPPRHHCFCFYSSRTALPLWVQITWN